MPVFTPVERDQLTAFLCHYPVADNEGHYLRELNDRPGAITHCKEPNVTGRIMHMRQAHAVTLTIGA